MEEKMTKILNRPQIDPNQQITQHEYRMLKSFNVPDLYIP